LRSSIKNPGAISGKVGVLGIFRPLNQRLGSVASHRLSIELPPPSSAIRVENQGLAVRKPGVRIVYAVADGKRPRRIQSLAVLFELTDIDVPPDVDLYDQEAFAVRGDSGVDSTDADPIGHS